VAQLFSLGVIERHARIDCPLTEATSTQNKTSMKTKHAVGIGMIGLALAATLFIAEKQASSPASQIIALKSGGETVAEIKVVKSTKCHVEVKGEKLTRDDLTKNVTLTGSGSLTIQFDPGAASITVKGDEIAMRSER
jgi:hypothetical protein